MSIPAASKLVEWIAVATGFIGVGAWVGQVDQKAESVDDKVELTIKDIERLSDVDAQLATLTERVGNMKESVDKQGSTMERLLIELQKR